MRGAGGQRCPEIDHACGDPLAAWALETAETPGLWVRAGFAGQVAGLDWSAALTLAPEADKRRLMRFLRAAEAGLLAHVRAATPPET